MSQPASNLQNLYNQKDFNNSKFKDLYSGVFNKQNNISKLSVDSNIPPVQKNINSVLPQYTGQTSVPINTTVNSAIPPVNVNTTTDVVPKKTQIIQNSQSSQKQKNRNSAVNTEKIRNVLSALCIVLIFFYGSLAKPELSPSVTNFFKNPFSQVIMLILILFCANTDLVTCCVVVFFYIVVFIFVGFTDNKS